MMDPEEAEDPGGGRLPAVEDRQSVRVDVEALAAAAARAAGSLGFPGDAVSLLLVDADEIAAMKEQALGVRAATDVLTFPIDDPDDPSPGPLMVGQIVLCPAVADRQARALGSTLDEEMVTLIAHGMLHLRGRDHADARAEVAMARDQRALVALAEAGRAGSEEAAR